MERLHKVTAGFVFAFICLHFAIHLIGLEGVATYQQVLEAARLIYRHPIVELLLLMAFVVQILTGVALSRTIWREKKDIVHQLQAASGTYLAVFTVLHVAWVFVGRLILNLDTNFDYASVTLSAPGWMYVAIPFYGLAIMAIFTHIGCICYDIFKKTNKRLGGAFIVIAMGAGGYVAYLILMMYTGRLYPVTLAEEYTEVFGQPVAVAPLAPESAKPAGGGATPQN